MELHNYILLLQKYFNREATPDDIRALAEWVRRPGIRKEFDTLCEELWLKADTSMDPALTDEIWNGLQQKINNSTTPKENKQRKRIPIVVYKVAASILLPICIGLGTYFMTAHLDSNKSIATEPFTISVDYGQKAEVVLPDGSKVWLNSASQLSYDASYNQKDRRIKLLGEAFFEVASNKEKRFIVSCNNIDIEAVGTMFDVKGYKSDPYVITSLQQGKVNVFDKTSLYTLEPGEVIAYRKDHKAFMERTTMNEDEMGAWRKSILIFDSTPLSEIALTLERMYGVNIKFDSDELKNVQFSGTIKNNSINKIFYLISLTYPLTYVVEGDTVRIQKNINP